MNEPTWKQTLSPCMRKVIYKDRRQIKEKCRGVFHQFGLEYEKLRNGVGVYTTAIIELKDGRIITVLPEQIRFYE